MGSWDIDQVSGKMRAINTAPQLTRGSLTIVFASHTAMSSGFVVGSHHLARNFSKAGHRVAHLVAPVSIAHVTRLWDQYTRDRFANWAAGGQVRRDQVFEYIPLSLVPWQVARTFLGTTNPYLWTIPSIPAVLRRHGFPVVDILLVDEPKLVGIERIVKPRVFAYRATDLYSEVTGDSVVGDAERLIVERAELLVATSGPVMDRLRGLAEGKPSLLVENGVELSHFSSSSKFPTEYRDIPSPRFVYVGALDVRFDWAGVLRAAQQMRYASFVLIGPSSRAPDPEWPANIYALGPRAYSEVPAYLQHADVALLPMNDHSANRGRSPMKLYEYGAAGLPVVASWTEELERRKLPFVALARNSIEFVAELNNLTTNAQERARRGEIARAVAATHDWSVVADELMSAVLRIREDRIAARGSVR